VGYDHVEEVIFDSQFRKLSQLRRLVVHLGLDHVKWAIPAIGLTFSANNDVYEMHHGKVPLQWSLSTHSGSYWQDLILALLQSHKSQWWNPCRANKSIRWLRQNCKKGWWIYYDQSWNIRKSTRRLLDDSPNSTANSLSTWTVFPTI
jgi:hypothetical protein